MLTDGRYYGSGEKNLFVRISGSGSPVIIIEPAWGSLSLEWWQIQEELSKIATVISYDRAGYAESPKASTPRTSTKITMELFNMLCNTTLPGPYLLIGHSLGGLYSQHFAKLFPRQIAGLVLVDSITTKVKEFDKIDAPNYHQYSSMKSTAENIRKLLDLEKEDYSNRISQMISGLYDSFPKQIADQLIVYQTDQDFCRIIMDEYEGLDESIEMINSFPQFPDIPIAVLSRDYNVMIRLSESIGIPADEARAVEELWLEHSKSLLNLSPNSEFYLVKGSSHTIHLTRPDAIIQATKNLIYKM